MRNKKARSGERAFLCVGEGDLADAFDGDGFQDDGGFRAVAAVAGELGDLFGDVVAFDDFTEDGVLSGEPGGVRGGDEELAAVGVGAGVGHGELAGVFEVVGGALGLVRELVAGAAHAGAFGVAALDHEVGDDAMEDGAVVELVAFFRAGVPLAGAFGELDEVLDGERGFFFEELADDVSFGGLEGGVGTGLGGCGHDGWYSLRFGRGSHGAALTRLKRM